MIIENLDPQSQSYMNMLLNRIKTKDCCVFIGAGLSKPAGYPLWDELLERLKIEAKRIKGEEINSLETDPYDRAETYRQILGEENYHSIINDIFNPEEDKQPWLATHLYIIEMPFVSFITTNYDCLIENAFKHRGSPPKYNFYPTLPVAQLRSRQIYHIHGVIDYSNLGQTQNSIVLTRSDFNQAYETGSTLLRLISCAYTELTVCFIGFSLNDPFLMKIISKSLAEYEITKSIAVDRGAGPLKDIKHFALLPYHKKRVQDRDGYSLETDEIDIESTNKENEKLKSFGVYSIRYASDKSNHTKLISMIKEMNIILLGKNEPNITQDVTFREFD